MERKSRAIDVDSLQIERRGIQESMKSEALAAVSAGKMTRVLGVILVNYNSFDDCCACVRSLERQAIVAPSDIVIVDNNSPDGSGARLASELPGVNVVHSDRNGGFGAGINLGVDRLDADVYLILNPDTYFLENRIQVALDMFALEPRLGVLGLKLINPDGTLQYSARRFYSLLTILLRRTRLSRWSMFQNLIKEHLMVDYWNGDTFDTDWVMGTGFLLRKVAFEDIGRMDEQYFLYMEDTDLCRRMWGAHWSVKATSVVSLVHKHQRVSAKKIFGRQARAHLVSLFRYWRKFGVPFWGHGPRY
jgi:GT2 family glycosyltransferase